MSQTEDGPAAAFASDASSSCSSSESCPTPTSPALDDVFPSLVAAKTTQVARPQHVLVLTSGTGSASASGHLIPLSLATSLAHGSAPHVVSLATLVPHLLVQQQQSATPPTATPTSRATTLEQRDSAATDKMVASLLAAAKPVVLKERAAPCYVVL
jgi:hypothetical protein